MAENPENNATTSGVTIGVVKESVPGETRVGLIPDSVKHLVGKGLQVVVQAGAGEGSSIADSEYEEAGASIVPTTADVHAAADVVVRVQSPSPDRGELDGLKQDQVLVSFLAPLVNHDLNRQLADSGVTAMAVDAVPRITRAQSMDALSAMSTIGGYKAVLLAAERLPKFFPLLMTAAGTIRPAKVLVLGAGVAGLQAIATARRLGAVVEAYDVRAVVKEQVESLGARFVEIDTGAGNAEVAGGYAREATPEELKKQQEGLNDHIANSDVVITTALVPGRPAPKMIPASAVERMRDGSVIVDLAAETGGNCELTTPGEVTKEHGVSIFGTLNLPATLPVHASQMYGKVMTNFLDLLVKDGQVNLNFDDEIISSMTITNRGEIVQAQTRKMMGLEVAEPAASEEPEPTSEDDVTDGEEPEATTDGVSSFSATDTTDETAGAVDESDASSTDEPTTYRPFVDADDASPESASAESSADTPYVPFADDVVPADTVSDPSTEIASYSVEEGYETVADQPPIELGDESDPSDTAMTSEVVEESLGSDASGDPLASADDSDSDSADSSIGSTEAADVDADRFGQGEVVTESGSDQSSMEFEDESVASESGSASDGAGETFATDVDYDAESLDTDDGTDLNFADVSAGSESISSDDGSDSWSEPGDDVGESGSAGSKQAIDADASSSEAAGDSAGFSGSTLDVDRVDEYRSESTKETVEADKLESFLQSENFDSDGDGSTAGSHSDKSQSVADARKSSKLPLVGEGTDWLAGDDTHDIPAGFPIKGNANSGIYHPEESPSYKETIAEIYFANGDVAEAHGYRLPKMLQKLADKAGEEAANETATHVDEEDDTNG